jgi:hypothetical protein
MVASDIKWFRTMFSLAVPNKSAGEESLYNQVWWPVISPWFEAEFILAVSNKSAGEDSSSSKALLRKVFSLANQWYIFFITEI